MKTTPTPSAAYFASLALQTRWFGSVYVHAGNRAYSREIDGIEYTVSGYGRSLQSGGHKYKVHARRDGKPVPTTELRAIRA